MAQRLAQVAYFLIGLIDQDQRICCRRCVGISGAIVFQLIHADTLLKRLMIASRVRETSARHRRMPPPAAATGIPVPAPPWRWRRTFACATCAPLRE